MVRVTGLAALAASIARIPESAPFTKTMSKVSPTSVEAVAGANAAMDANEPAEGCAARSWTRDRRVIGARAKALSHMYAKRVGGS